MHTVVDVGPVFETKRDHTGPLTAIVVVPAFRAGRFLDQTVQSILGQRFDGLKSQRDLDANLVIAENGDSLPGEDVETYLETMVQTQPSDKVWGLSAVRVPLANKAVAMNSAILQFGGFYQTRSSTLVFLCDADDLWTPEKMETQIRWMMANPQVDVLGTRFEYMDEDGNPLPNTPELPLGHQEIVETLDRGENPLANSSVCYWADLHRYGLFDPLNKCEDYEWWKRLREMGSTFANLPMVGMRHRLHKGSYFNGSRQQGSYKTFTDNCYKVHQTMRGVP